MGKSGNPAKRAEKTISSASDFKKKKGGIFTLPSGATVRLKNPGGLRVFLSEGMIPNSLLPIVDEALKGNKPKAEDVVKPGGEVDPKMIEEMMTFLDNLTIRCVVEPKVHATPEDEDEKDEDLLYVDDIDDMDKMFIFQWLSGGTADLETFRAGHQESLESLG